MALSSQGSPNSIVPSETVIGANFDQVRPKYRAGTDKMKPVSGPLAPISNNSSRLVSGDLMRIKAPKVPIKVGAGMK